jgi:hypothetical protein
MNERLKQYEFKKDHLVWKNEKLKGLDKKSSRNLLPCRENVLPLPRFS